ncbi:MAG TPA: ATPase [Pilimelia sp.]|nr:ATPase [Pilimelia sp.]
MVEGPEISQERTEQPATRWRALLDRARGARSDDPVPDPGDDLSWLDDGDPAQADPWPPRAGATYVSVAARQAHEPDWSAAPPEGPPARPADADRRRHLPPGYGPAAGDARPAAPPDPRPGPYRAGRPGGPPPAQARAARTRVAERPPGRPRPPEPGFRLSEPAPRQPWDEGPVTWRPRLGDGQRGRAVEALAGRPGVPGADLDAPGPGGRLGAAGALLAERGGQLSFRRVAVADDDPAVRLRGRFGGPRVIAFANPKGGVHKTTATVLAAATIGAARGRGVVAWDDNELRGTLGLRAGTARHARTVRHLVAELECIEQAPDAVVRDRLDEYLRHAPDASYDILAGEEDPRFARQLDAVTVQRVLDLLRRTHEVICVDTGNNVQSANWQTVLRGCDQLVVTTVPREDAAFAADWMLDLLHEIGLGALADNAVTLVSSTTPTRSALARDIERHFAGRTRAVVAVPYDPALETGSAIDHHALRPGTRRDWLRAAATVMAPFVS